MKRTCSAADFDGNCGGERIQRAIDAADDESGRAVVTVGPDGPDDGGTWLLEQAVELPSHTTLSLRGAHLRLAEGANDNLLRNRHLEDGDEEIHVIGDGEARIDGTPEAQDRDWDALYRNYGVHLFNVDSLSVRGVSIGPTNSFALTLEDVRDARVESVEFAQDGQTGNQDGLHVLGPAERVTVNGITGATGDDAVAVDSTESDVLGRGSDGPISSVAVTNVAVHNVHSTGLFRTIADREAPLENVYAGNLAMTGGTDEGDAALKIGFADIGVETMPRPADHRNVTVENVYLESWDAPYCAVQAPIRNLTLRGLRGRHSGPFFYTLENDLDGVLIDDCKTTLVGNPPDTLINDFHERLIEGTQQDRELRGRPLERPPGIITLDNAHCTDVTVADSRFATEIPDRVGTVGCRVYEGTTVDGLALRDTTFRDVGRGLHVEAGATVRNVVASGVRQPGVGEPWSFDAPLLVHGEGNVPPCPLSERELTLSGGERRRITISDVPLSVRERISIRAVPLEPAGREHGYRVDSVGTVDEGMRIVVEETADDAGGEVRILLDAA